MPVVLGPNPVATNTTTAFIVRAVVIGYFILQVAVIEPTPADTCKIGEKSCNYNFIRKYELV